MVEQTDLEVSDKCGWSSNHIIHGTRNCQSCALMAIYWVCCVLSPLRPVYIVFFQRFSCFLSNSFFQNQSFFQDFFKMKFGFAQSICTHWSFLFLYNNDPVFCTLLFAKSKVPNFSKVPDSNKLCKLTRRLSKVNILSKKNSDQTKRSIVHYSPQTELHIERGNQDWIEGTDWISYVTLFSFLWKKVLTYIFFRQPFIPLISSKVYFKILPQLLT